MFYFKWKSMEQAIYSFCMNYHRDNKFVEEYKKEYETLREMNKQ